MSATKDNLIDKLNGEGEKKKEKINKILEIVVANYNYSNNEEARKEAISEGVYALSSLIL